MDEKDALIALALVLGALALSLSTFGSQYLFSQQSYTNALQIKGVITGANLTNSTPSAYAQLSAFAYSRAADYAGAPSFDAGLLLTVLKLENALLAAISAAAAYFALSRLFTKEASAFGAAMLVFSLPAAGAFLSGIATPSSLGLALLTCALAFLAAGLKEKGAKSLAFPALGGFFSALAILAWPPALLAFTALSLAVIAEAALALHRKSKPAFLAGGAAFIAIGAAGAFAEGFTALSLPADPGTAFSLLLLFAPLLAIAVVAEAIRVYVKAEAAWFTGFALMLGLASAVAAAYSPQAALPGAAVLAALGLESLSGVMKGKYSTMAAAGFASGFAAFAIIGGVFGNSGATGSSSAVIGVLVGIAGALAAYAYGGGKAREYVDLGFACVLVFAAVTGAFLIAQSQSPPVSDEVAGALAWISANTEETAVIAAPSGADTISFISGRTVVTEGVAGWLLGNASGPSFSSLDGADYVLIDYSNFDSLEYLKNESGKQGARIDVFVPVGSDSASGYNIFYSQSRATAYVPIRSGIGSLEYAYVIDANGNQNKVPVARFLFIYNSKGEIVRAVLPYEGYNINLFNAFFGTLPGALKLYPAGSGTAMVFGVPE